MLIFLIYVKRVVCIYFLTAQSFVKRCHVRVRRTIREYGTADFCVGNDDRFEAVLMNPRKTYDTSR